jgi:hypothetical protein
MATLLAGLVIVGVPVGLLAYVAGRFLRHNAPFYAAWNIVAVGVIFGVLGVLVVWGSWRISPLPNSLLWTAFAVGLLATFSIGGPRSRLDPFAKSTQVAVVASLTYGLLGGAILVVTLVAAP